MLKRCSFNKFRFNGVYTFNSKLNNISSQLLNTR